MRELLRMGGMNVYDLLTENFASDALKGAIAFDAMLGTEYAAALPGHRDDPAATPGRAHCAAARWAWRSRPAAWER